MNYEEFLTSAASELQQRIPGAEIGVRSVEKLQGMSYRGITFGPAGSMISATMNLEQQFAELMQGRPYSDILSEVRSVIEDNLTGMPVFELSSMDHYETLKAHLFIEMVGAERNQEMLADIPHERIEDMATVYRIFVDGRSSDEQSESASILITNSLLEKLGVSEEQLKADALEAAPNTKPPAARSEGQKKCLKDMQERNRRKNGKEGGSDGTAGMEAEGTAGK